MAEEFWDIYDEHRVRTGEVIARGTAHGPGQFHLVVTLCMFDDAGRMLIQRRTDEKELRPGLWDVTVGGSAIAGESSREAMVRETREELGLALDLDGVRPAFTANYAAGFDDVYIVRAAPEISRLAVPNREVAEVRWALLDEILDLHADGKFLPYRESFLRFVWDFVGRDDILG